MLAYCKHFAPFLALIFALTFMDMAIAPQHADARARSGGRSFSIPSSRPSPSMAPRSGYNSSYNQRQNQQTGGMGRGFMGGLLGGALGGMLFGSLFGAHGSGMGILPLLLLAGIGYFFYKRFVNRPPTSSSSGYQPPPFGGQGSQSGTSSFGAGTPPPIPPIRPDDAPQGAMSVADGLAAIRQNDPGFNEKDFLQMASDVFFKVQAGWMRRDVASFKSLLGTQLASEYENDFAQMKAQGRSNKLENIAIRGVDIVAADSNASEECITVLFTANLLDYTVDDKTGALLEGSMTEPVKFAENWTWARPLRVGDWKLEGIAVAEG